MGSLGTVSQSLPFVLLLGMMVPLEILQLLSVVVVVVMLVR